MRNIMNPVIQHKEFLNRLPKLLTKYRDPENRAKIFAIEKLYQELAEIEIRENDYWGKVIETSPLWLQDPVNIWKSLWRSMVGTPRKLNNRIISYLP